MCPENSGRPVGVGKVTRFGKRKIQPASLVNNAMTKRPARRPNPHSGRPFGKKKQHPFGMGSFVARANCLFVTRIFRRTTRWGRQNRGGSLWNKTKQGCGPVCEGAVRRGTARWGNVAGRRGRSGMWNEPPEFFGARAARMGKMKTFIRIFSGSGQVPFLSLLSVSLDADEQKSTIEGASLRVFPNKSQSAFRRKRPVFSCVRFS